MPPASQVRISHPWSLRAKYVVGGLCRLIEATDKQPKSAHIRRRVKMAVGKTVEAALKMQVPDKDGDMVRYKKSDFKYDVKAGFLRF